MLDKKILDIFYNKIAKETETGQINCYFMVNIAFNISINNELINDCNKINYEGLIIPTLKINNPELFNSLLIEYVKKALEFYASSDFIFLEDLNTQNFENLDTLKEEYKIKYIICMLFANASISDFNNPIQYITNRIAMFDIHFLEPNKEKYIGFIESINAKLYAREEKSPIQAETPYCVKSFLKFNDDYLLELPDIYAGSNGDTSYLYGVQKTTAKEEVEERPYLKQIRKGFIAKLNGAPEHYFLAVMLYLSLSSDKEIEVIPYLITRWNAKRIALIKKSRQNNTISVEDISEEQNKIQQVLTDILIRYFTKIADVSTGVEITSFPFELDSNLHLQINADFISRCSAFNELYNLIDEYRQQKKLN